VCRGTQFGEHCPGCDSLMGRGHAFLTHEWFNLAKNVLRLRGTPSLVNVLVGTWRSVVS
jgi:hypothetical protein